MWQRKNSLRVSAAVWVIITVWLIEFQRERDVNLISHSHPPARKTNDTANLIPPSVSLFPQQWMNLKQLKNWARPCILLPSQPSLANQRIASLIFIAEVPLGEKKHSPSYCLSLSLSHSPLMVTPLDFGNLRLGVKMAASCESSHLGWLPQCWLLGHAKPAKRRRYENRTGGQGWGQGTCPVAPPNKKDMGRAGTPRGRRLIRRSTAC